MKEKIQIQFLGLQTKEVVMKIDSYNNSVADEVDTQLKIKNGFTSEDKHIFAIIFELTLENKERNFYLKVEAHNHFRLNQEITDEFKDSTFINVNAPAIAFPYVRAFISNLTLNSGYDPIILPSYNFVNIYKENISENNN